MRGGYSRVNRQFQAKTSQPETAISETMNPIESKFEDRPETLRLVVTIEKCYMADGRHLENLICHHVDLDEVL